MLVLGFIQGAQGASWSEVTVKVVKQYINNGGDVNASAPENTDYTVLHMAATNQNPKVIELLIEAGANVYAAGYDMDKNTPLSIASGENTNVTVIKAFISGGSNVESRDLEGWTPLHWAAFKNPNPSVIKALIDAGANINAQNDDGETPLHLAVQENRNPSAARALTRAGAGEFIADEDGVTVYRLLNR